MIAQAELLPVLVSRLVYSDLVKDRPVLCMIDNVAARAALIKGSSSNAHFLDIVDAIIEHDMADHTLTWYARVPSASNLADNPSRGLPRLA